MGALELTAASRPLVGPSIWRRIRGDVLLLGAGNLLTVLGQLAFRSILIAMLAPTSYGRLSLVLGVYNTVWILGASGLPSAVARHVAFIAPGEDRPVLRAALRASAIPAAIASLTMALVAGLVLRSPLAGLLGAAGLLSLVYSLLAMGVLRGRSRMGAAATIMPIAAAGEVLPLALLWIAGAHVTLLLAFSAFCLGNGCGLAAGALLTRRTRPTPAHDEALTDDAASAPPTPSASELLGFSAWLAAATAGVAILPMVIRVAAALDSYTVVAMVDIAIVLLAIPQRIGTIVLFAVVPHAARAARREEPGFAISLRENLIVGVPFVALAAVVAWTPIVGWAFEALGRPAYGHGAHYLALALLASPARMLYGMVEGILIARGEGRFLAVAALSVAALSSAAIFAGVALGSTLAAFAVFALALWATYVVGLRRVNRLASAQSPA